MIEELFNRLLQLLRIRREAKRPGYDIARRVASSAGTAKPKPGRQTTPSNALYTWGWGRVPRRGGHAVDISTIDVRRYSAQQLLELLADISPDVSLALWNVLRLAGGMVSQSDDRAQGKRPDRDDLKLFRVAPVVPAVEPLPLREPQHVQQLRIAERKTRRPTELRLDRRPIRRPLLQELVPESRHQSISIRVIMTHRQFGSSGYRTCRPSGMVKGVSTPRTVSPFISA